MKYPLFLIGILTILISGCKKEDNLVSACVDQFLEIHDMKRYYDDDIGCHYYTDLYEYKEEPYFMIVNTCVGGLPIQDGPYTCNGESLCPNNPEDCIDFFENSIYIKIVGVEK